MLKPEFHQVHEDLMMVDNGPVQVPRLILPLVTQLPTHFLQEDSELVELVLRLLLTK